MKKEIPRHWATVVNTTPLKSICQVVEKDGKSVKVIASEIMDSRIADFIASIPNDIKVLESIIDYMYDKEKAFYLTQLMREDVTPIFKHVSYLKERLEAFRAIYGELPQIDKLIREYKPVITPE